MKIQLAPCRLRVPRRTLAKLSEDLNADTPADCKASAVRLARQKLPNSAAMNISTSSGCQGFLVTIN